MANAVFRKNIFISPRKRVPTFPYTNEPLSRLRLFVSRGDARPSENQMAAAGSSHSIIGIERYRVATCNFLAFYHSALVFSQSRVSCQKPFYPASFPPVDHFVAHNSCIPPGHEQRAKRAPSIAHRVPAAAAAPSVIAACSNRVIIKAYLRLKYGLLIRDRADGVRHNCIITCPPINCPRGNVDHAINSAQVCTEKMFFRARKFRGTTLYPNLHVITAEILFARVMRFWPKCGFRRMQFFRQMGCCGRERERLASGAGEWFVALGAILRGKAGNIVGLDFFLVVAFARRNVGRVIGD